MHRNIFLFMLFLPVSFGGGDMLFGPWTVGASLMLASSARLAEGYEATGGRKPGVGAFIRYQSELEGGGMNAEVSGEFLHQDITVRRPVLQGTEAGRGNILTGKSLGLRGDYDLAVRSDLLLSPVQGLRYSTVYQDAYGEADDIAFPVSYSRSDRENTDLLMGVEMMKKTVSGFRFDGGAGAEISLKRRQNAGMGMQYATSSFGVKAGWQRMDYREDDFRILANYTWFF
ncbi:autotransporter outer membrane beta-barrel domain-containing protein [Salmonella enterica subsp. salamae]|nr:autotransporter outer membrane beta-barrel domain-containing protein [Salmonella enterica subsp. salamae serovar Sofia]EBS4543926.1 autotransporter outer membrane beta-barrel domain-containing protein [Salmonella enterica subsp. salamae serovar Sofia]